MKILMVTPGRLPVPAVKGGAVENLIQLLLKYNEQNGIAEITVVSSYDEEAVIVAKEYQNSEFNFFKRNVLGEVMMQKHILPYRFFDYCFSRKVGKYLKKRGANFDVVIVQNELVNGWVMKRYIQGDYIYHAHNDTLHSRKEKDVKFLQSCKKIITISNYLSQCFKEKSQANHVVTIHNGINTDVFQMNCNLEERRYLRKKYDIKDDEIVVVFAGRMVREKGIDILIDAIRRIPEERKIKLLVMGTSFFKESGENAFTKRLKALSKSIEDRIIFSGYVDYQNMPSYYSMADIGCVPSMWEEPFGLTVIEQMAMELPVIVTDSGAIPEIVDDSCGYLIVRDTQVSEKIADAIVDLSVHAEKREKMGHAGREKILAHFSQQLFCEEWFLMVTGRSKDGAVV